MAEGSRTSFKDYNLLAYLLHGKNIKNITKQTHYVHNKLLCHTINLPFIVLPYSQFSSQRQLLFAVAYVCFQTRWKNP